MKMDNFICGGYSFSSNFDSGNLHKVELVKWNEEILPTNNLVGVEFNLSTKPDCAGTEYENLNRSWFFFCIQGGEPNKVCKLNIINLNKQSKLFSQGMHPVIRIGETGKWERIKDSPIYMLNDGDFVLSFFHKPQENITTKYYYAFTFPFTYTECQNQLKNFDSFYQKTSMEINYMIQSLNGDSNFNVNIHETNANENIQNDQYAGEDVNRQLKALNNLTTTEIENDIYYHRELLINSVEGRRVDLLTISSFHNIQYDREYRFCDLFPDTITPRCNLFKDKKVIFISSRVHPGETPASFVLNGFLKMILDKKSKYASILRKMYVFKIVPFLNPDGVFTGCYRSDTLGHNLNRVYLSPKIETQPSIYAVRKLIRYYHDDKDIEENVPNTISNNVPSEEEINLENKNNNNSANCCFDNTISPESTASSKPDSISESKVEVIKQQVEILIESDQLENVSSQAASTSTNSPNSSKSSSPSSTRSPSSETETESGDSVVNITSTTSPHSSDSPIIDPLKIEKSNRITVHEEKTVFCNKFIVEITPSITTSIPLMPLQKNTLDSNKSMKNVTKVNRMSLKSTTEMRHTLNTVYQESLPSSSSSASCRSNSARDEMKKENQLLFKSNTGMNKKLLSSSNQTIKTYRRNKDLAANNNINISSDFIEKNRASDRKMDACNEKSNMFLYIDLHGHASKKGIFMYGNHLPNVAEAVECMLLPRLMSMNCHHFHFDACVFSERNMYHKGKRDGLSKEGSGRVALYKAIGLVKCYTLESNYNTGKYVNTLPARGKETNIRKVSHLPPKYTPAIYEEVGRALGPSILDLTDSNPLSRLRNSEFRSLQGLRSSLRNEVDRSLPRNIVNTKVVSTQSKLRYLKTSTACCSSLTTEISKENKCRISSNKQQTTYGKKEKPSTILLARKKGKILCDVIPTSSAKFQDHTQPQPIPNKRPKVVLNKKLISDEKLEADLKSEFESELAVDTNNVITNKTFPSDELIIELPSPTFIEPTEQSASSSSSFESHIPCCSYQLLPSVASTSIASTSFLPKMRKAGSFTRKSPPTAPSMLINQSSILQGKKLKKSTGLKLRGNFAGGGSSSNIAHPTLLRSARRTSLSKDGRKLKKKKLLKPDATLKRKKSKVF